VTFQQTSRGSAAALGFVVVSVIFAVLTAGFILATKPTAINADRAEARSKALAEIHAAEEAALTTPATLDSKRGIVRLPIETAMQIAAQKWANPSAARVDLNARAEKSVAPVKTESFE
jgi:hypothetical protein